MMLYPIFSWLFSTLGSVPVSFLATFHSSVLGVACMFAAGLTGMPSVGIRLLIAAMWLKVSLFKSQCQNLSWPKYRICPQKVLFEQLCMWNLPAYWTYLLSKIHSLSTVLITIHYILYWACIHVNLFSLSLFVQSSLFLHCGQFSTVFMFEIYLWCLYTEF